MGPAVHVGTSSADPSNFPTATKTSIVCVFDLPFAVRLSCLRWLKIDTGIPGRDFAGLREAVVRLTKLKKEGMKTKPLKGRTVRAYLKDCVSMQVDFANLDYLFIPVVIQTDGLPLDGSRK